MTNLICKILLAAASKKMSPAALELTYIDRMVLCKGGLRNTGGRGYSARVLFI